MELKNKFLSVVTVYSQQNHHLLEKSLLTISGQSGCNFTRVIIIDTYGNLDLNNKLFNRKSSLDVTIIKKLADISYYDALNVGVSETTTEWVSFLELGNSYVSKNTIEEIAAVIKSNDADIYYGNSQKVINSSSDKYKTIGAKPIKTISKAQPFDFQSCIFRTSIMKSFKFNPLYKYAAEYELLVRLFRGEISFCYLPFAISKSSFSKSLDERLEKLFIISKYFGEEALKNSKYFERYVRASAYEVKRLMPLYEKIKKTENLIEEQKSILKIRQSEYAQIKETKVYKFGRKIDGLLSNILWRADK